MCWNERMDNYNIASYKQFIPSVETTASRTQMLAANFIMTPLDQHATVLCILPNRVPDITVYSYNLIQ